jgi:Adenosine deaminase
VRVTRSGNTGCVSHSLTLCIHSTYFLRRQLAAERSDDTVIQSQAHRLTQKGESWTQLSYLGRAHRVPMTLTQLLVAGERSLADCFVLFDVIHRLTTRHEVVTRITTEVVADAAADGVLYLELRTTPKARSTSEVQSHVTFLFTQYVAAQNNPAASMTKRSYVDAVLQGP